MNETTIIRAIYTCTRHQSNERHSFTQVKAYDEKTYRLTSVKFISATGATVSNHGAFPKVVCSQCDYNEIGDNAKMTGKPIKGRIVETIKCADKCITAVGPSCDCSCGGENHGGSFDLGQMVVA